MNFVLFNYVLYIKLAYRNYKDNYVDFINNIFVYLCERVLAILIYI